MNSDLNNFQRGGTHFGAVEGRRHDVRLRYPEQSATATTTTTTTTTSRWNTNMKLRPLLCPT